MRTLNTKRKKYNKTIKNVKVCEFCNPKRIKEQECKSLSGEHWMVFVSKYPYLDGNLMIIPKEHITKIDDLTNDQWIELQMIIIKTQKKLTKIFKTKSFNLGLNIGPESGASIDHLHLQIIPRKINNHTALNLFADLYAISTSPKDLKKMIEKA